MTSGVKLIDHRSPVVGYQGQSGHYYRKEWNGADWPIIPKTKPPLLQKYAVAPKRRVFTPAEILADLHHEGPKRDLVEKWQSKMRANSDRKKLNAMILENNRIAIEAYKREIRSVIQRKVRRQRERRSEYHSYTWDVFQEWDTMNSWEFLPPPPHPSPPHIYSGSYDAGFGYPTYTLRDWSSDDDYNLAEKLKTKILGSDFNLGVFIAESSEALSMIFNAANRLSLALRAMSRNDYATALRHIRPSGSAASARSKRPGFITNVRTAAATELEVAYGWLPLISDLQSGAEMLAHMTSAPYMQRVKARRVVKGEVLSSAPSVLTALGHVERRKQVIAYVHEVNVPQLVGLTDLASIAWERLPWSFVADWAIPIGNYLSARGIAAALKATYVTTSSFNMMVTGYDVKASNLKHLSGDEFYNFQRSYGNRTISSELPCPLPQVKPFGEMLSWKRAANAVSLLVQKGVKS